MAVCLGWPSAESRAVALRSTDPCTSGRLIASSSRGSLRAVRDPQNKRNTRAVFACSTKHPLRVAECGTESSCIAAAADANGCLAALGWNYGGKSGGATTVSSIDLCKGRARLVATGPPASDSHGDYFVSDVIVGTRGRLAWIWGSQRLSPGVVGPTVQEVIARSDGHRRVLDSSPDIDARSLAIAGSRLYWMKADVAQSAVIR